MNFTVRSITEADREWVLKTIRSWGADFIVSRGRKIFAAELPGLCAEDEDGNIVGLLTYEIVNDQCEVVTLDAFEKFAGIGTELMKRVVETARAQACKRLWLITTNDNTDAIRFYQKRGMIISAIHVDAIAHSRTLKPTIPEFGSHGIPVRDEIEFEMRL
jgi:ribosomal protein S18 acetylase RimI-like enzyme